jgi:hypothetical protein
LPSCVNGSLTLQRSSMPAAGAAGILLRVAKDRQLA